MLKNDERRHLSMTYLDKDDHLIGTNQLTLRSPMPDDRIGEKCPGAEDSDDICAYECSGS